MIFDANANVGPTLLPDGEFEFEPTLAALRTHLAEAGVDRAVVAPLKPPDYAFDAANARLADVLADREEFVGIGRVDPRRDAAADAAERALVDYGLAGLKIDPWEETFHVDEPYVHPVAEVAADHDVPLWIRSGYFGTSHALSVRELASSFPGVPMVLTHGAHLDVSGRSVADALVLAAETDNTYFETSGVYRHDFILDAVATVGGKRVLFGSNAPYFLPELEVSRVADAYIDDEQKELALGRSLADLLG